LIQEMKGNLEAARQEYEKVLAAEPRAGVAANNLAWMYAESGRTADAIRLASIAREQLRGRPEPDDTFGWAQYQAGATAEAITAFERAIEKAPNNPTYHHHLGLALERGGQAEKARAAFRRAEALKQTQR
jgi:Flp pilus assembly protein TadD